MVCPYCNFKNATNALVCNQCGVLLRLGKTSRLVPQGGGGGGGGFAFMRGLLPGGRLKSQQASLQTRTAELTTETQERAEEELKNPDRAPAARLVLGALGLVTGEVEKSIHWFQQARQMGHAEAEYFNNAGVALARRGTLPQAVEMFDRAVRVDGNTVAPRANYAHLFAEAGVDADPETAEAAIGEIRRALALEPKNPVLYNRLALILCRERRYEEAIPQFQQAIAFAKDNPAVQADGHNDVGLARCLSGDLIGSGAAFDAALRLDPNHAHAQCNQSLAQMQEVVTGPLLEKLQRAAKIDPASGAVRANYGYGLCRFGALNDGILELKEALGMNPRLFEACYNIGKAYVDHDALDIGERYLARALQFSPHSGEVLTALGVVKTQQKLIPQAVQYLQAAVKIWPQLTLARTNLGIALGLAGDFAEAGLHLRKAAELDPDNPDIPAQTGWLHLLQDNMTAGLEELGIAVRLDEHVPEVQNNFGICYIALGKPELSLSHFKRVQDLKPEFQAVHYQWGYAHAALKNVDSALREWDLTAKAEPANPDCHVNRGVLLYQKGQIDEAIAEFRHVIVLRQTRMEDYSNLGLAYAKSGLTLRNAARNPQDPRMKQSVDRHKQAIDMFDRALAIDQRNVMLHSNRGLACFFAGRAEDAMHEWGMVSQIDPAYARRRGKRQQSEFDDTQIALVSFSVPERAAPIPPKTAGYLPRFLAGYDTEEWDLMLNDPSLIRLAEMRREAKKLDRDVNAL